MNISLYITNELYSICMLKIARWCQIIFQSSFTDFHLYKEWAKPPFHPFPPIFHIIIFLKYCLVSECEIEFLLNLILHIPNCYLLWIYLILMDGGLFFLAKIIHHFLLMFQWNLFNIIIILYITFIN